MPETQQALSVLYANNFFPVGQIVPVLLTRVVCDRFEKDGQLIALVKKDINLPPHFDNVVKRGFLLQFKNRIINTGGQGQSLMKTTSPSFQWILVESSAEVDITGFDPKTYLSDYSIFAVPGVSDVEAKESKQLLIEKLDKLLTKLESGKSGIAEYYKIDSLAELTNIIFRFLRSYGQFPKNKAIQYLENSNLSQRLGLLLESLEGFYYSLNTKKVDPKTGKPSVAPDNASASLLDISKYRNFVTNVKNMDEDTKQEINRRIDYLASMHADTGEKANIINYLDTILLIPWDTNDQSELNLSQMAAQMDQIQYGMTDAKQHLMQYLAASLNKGQGYVGKVICLIGPPGTGKTLFAKNIAKILKRKFTPIPLGGVDDVTILRGQRKGWVGAEPGQLVKALIRAKSMNPVIILDEIDKISGYRADQIKAALLEILDPNQNSQFRDAYLDIPIDLSKIMFVATGNYLAGIPAPLYDRLEIISIEPYSPAEKLEITQKFVIPQLFSDTGVTDAELLITAPAIQKIIAKFKFDPGMRRISQTLSQTINKYLVQKLQGQLPGREGQTQYQITEVNLPDYVKDLENSETVFDPHSSVVGLTNIFWARTEGQSIGGGRGCVQVSAVPGSGHIVNTGNVGEDVKESTSVAIGFIRNNAQKFGIETDYFDKHDINIHQPSLATHKIGPSGGLATTTAILSAIKNFPLPQSIGMTGEIDLNGNALIIGGVKYKTRAAYEDGITTFILPQANKSDYDNEVDENIKKNIKFYFISNLIEALKVFFPDWHFDSA